MGRPGGAVLLCARPRAGAVQGHHGTVFGRLRRHRGLGHRGYSDFLKKITVAKEIKEFKVYRDIALACGYAFKVGVISEAHKAALRKEDDSFDIVVTGCK